MNIVFHMFIRTIPRACSKLLSSRFRWKKKDREKRGGSQILVCMYARGGGGVIQMRTVCNRGGGGV